jgi:carbamoyl-phosphate synthase large subunit
MGGQTALNTALALRKDGVLEKYGVELIGAKPTPSTRPRTGKLFREAMDQDRPRNAALASPKTLIEALEALDDHRPAGHHPAVLHARRHRRRHRLQQEEFEEIVERGLDASPTMRC